MGSCAEGGGVNIIPPNIVFDLSVSECCFGRDVPPNPPPFPSVPCIFVSLRRFSFFVSFCTECVSGVWR